MQLISRETKIDFLGRRRIALIGSLVIILVSLASIAVQGLKLGVDFTGGTLIELGYPESVDLGPIRQQLAQADFGDAQVQYFGSAKDVLIRIAPRADLKTADISTGVLVAIDESGQSAPEVRRVEFVGPQVGEELTEEGGLAIIYALGLILLYVAFRFEKRFAAGAVVALGHDVIITIGIFSLFQIEFDLTVLAAILAVIGYSLNDTIVVFDRIRENFRVVRKGRTEEVMNRSVNQTLSRTLITSMTTLLVLFSLLFLGGEVIHGFAIALIIGIVVGTYSSIYVASSAALALGISREDMMPRAKEEQTEG